MKFSNGTPLTADGVVFTLNRARSDDPTLSKVSGQLGLVPETGEFAAGGVAGQARQSLTNVKHILEAAGSGLEKVVKVTVFLKDIKDFAAMNAVYSEFFKADYPARSAVQAAALPKDGLVEIEVIAET